MTAQASDRVKYRGKSYSVAGNNGVVPFDPAAHGLEPVGKSSDCWRGFLCTYVVEGGHLLLNRLAIHLDNRRPPALFGVMPTREKGGREFDAVYEGLAHRVSCSGGLLVADDFISEMYAHMGFHPAWKYREVHELEFRDGRLVREADRSAQIAEFRREPGARTEPADLASWFEQYSERAAIERWIEAERGRAGSA